MCYIDKGDDMKVNNLHNVLKYIINSKAISRADISRNLSLNKATVSYLTNQLEELGIIAPQEELKKTNGRHSVLYELNKNYANVISINVKPQNIIVYVTLLDGEIIFQNKINKKVTDSGTLLSVAKEIISTLIIEYPNNIGVGIGIHGTVDNSSVINFTPYNNIENFDLTPELEKSFPNINFYIENEANVTALGESNILDEETAITITNSKGIGSGIIVDYKVYGGSKGFAGEIGHTIVEPNGLLCPCGNKGCLEQYSSEENIFSKISEIKGYEITNSTFIDLYTKKDTDVLDVYFKSLDYLSIAINNVINLLNPNTIVLNSFLYGSIDETINYIRSKIPNQINKVNIFTTSTLKDKAFSIGFAKLIVEDYFITKASWDE